MVSRGFRGCVIIQGTGRKNSSELCGVELKMDSLTDKEFEGIWQRNKKYIQLDKIKSITRRNIKEEIAEAVRTSSAPSKKKAFNPQANSNFLLRRGFAERASRTKNIVEELLAENVNLVKVRNQPRYQIKKGSATIRTKSGKVIKAGQFISGKTKEEAIENLLKKTEE